MTAPDINFRNIRKHRSSQNDGFEELTRQLVLADPPDNCTSIENRGPGADGGVEILVRFSGGQAWGWQSKYFTDSFGASEVAQLKKSFVSALVNFPRLERYYIAIPRNLSGHAEGDQDTQRKNWEGFKSWCNAETAKLGRLVAIKLWDDSYFVSRLQRNEAIYAGMRMYWFNEKALDAEWFRHQFDKSFAYIGKRYRPDDHVEVRIADTVRVLRRDKSYNCSVQNVSKITGDALAILESLIKLNDEVGQLKEHCVSFSATLREDGGVLAGCDHQDLYADTLSETLNKISSIRSRNQSYQILADATYERTEKTDSKTGKIKLEYAYSDKVRRKLRDLATKLQEAESEFSAQEIKLLKRPILLVDGEAGIGKSHLLASEVDNHIKYGAPAIFLPARVLDHGDRPEQDILRYLDSGDLRFETLLSALQAAALASDCPVLFVIDGINESLFARGWESGLPSLITQISKFNRVALCVSIRSSYRELCIRSELDIIRISHHGFRGHLGEAAKEYLDRHGIERPSAPIFGLNEILYNPLFLSTAVDFMNATDQTSFPRAMDSLASLISFWLGAIEQNLITKGFDRISLNDGKLSDVMKRLASEMATAGSEYIAYEFAHRICEEIIDLAPPAKQSDRLLPRLIDEGMLLDYPSYESDTGKRVSFGFQKFSDYFMADAIMRDCRSPESLARNLKKDGKYQYLFAKERYFEFSGPRVALLALTPARMGRELASIEDNFFASVRISVKELMSSLSWRRSQDITEETVNLIERQRRRQGKNGPLIDDSSWFDLLLELAPIPDCLLNASYLKKELASLSLGERDAKWSIYLVGKTETYDDDWSVIQQLIDWAWVAPKSALEAAKIHQVAIALALMTSTMDRVLRDCATKALASLLIKFPDEISTLIDEFSDWEDSYVRERVLAAAMAGVLYCNNVKVLKDAALAADRMVFRKCPVERHAWTRRYAQIIVDHALFSNVGIDENMISRSAPPYLSEPILDWPTLEQVAPKREHASSIFSSVVGFIGAEFDGKPPMMTGDFGRYTMGGIDDNFSAVNRGGQPPLARKDEVKHFWDQVDAISQDAQDAHIKLVLLFELQEKVSLFGRLNLLNQDSGPMEGDDLEEEGEAGTGDITSPASLAQAESSLLSMLSPELRYQYQLLHPLNRLSDSSIPKFSLLKGQCWVFSRTLSLGWQAPLHDAIEKNRLRYSHGRHDHHVERIGKKYQHIAFGELVGYLADYHWYLDWNNEPCMLKVLEDFKRADIDATYLGGSLSKPIEMFLPDSICVPEMAFIAGNPASNMAWTKTLENIPDPTHFFIQSGADGSSWCLVHSFCRSKDYMKGFESSDPFRSAQYGIELILVDKAELEKLRSLNTDRVNQNTHDVFEGGWSSPAFLGQRSFRHQGSIPPLSLSYNAADFRFARITETFSPKYSEFDRSGVSDETDFTTPHPALIAELKLSPKNGWSGFFVTTDGQPAFSDNPSFLAGVTAIRHDLIEQFAENHNLSIVWRVWVEKDGGLGINHGSRQREQFARNDFIGFFFEDGGIWSGHLIPFRD